MKKKGKEQFYEELEKFVVTRLRAFPTLRSYESGENWENAEERQVHMDIDWVKRQLLRQSRGNVECPHITNHTICHEMFWNACKGYSRLYIQIRDLTSEQEGYSDCFKTKVEGEEESGVVTLSCTLLSLQMLDYDTMMFQAMENENEEYRQAAIKHYRPYLFDYVAEINQEQYKKIQEIQRQQKSEESDLSFMEDSDNSYFWLECTFEPNDKKSYLELDGYVVQSASRIEKIRAQLSILENDKNSAKMKKEVLDAYKLKRPCVSDPQFCNELKNKLDRLESIYIYRIGNGNCVYAESKNQDSSFFYDIGFNYKHQPKKLTSRSTYNYSSAMHKIYAQTPSFFILSHWDMDHVAGSYAAKKGFLDKKWFASDCKDAGTNIMRLAKYLDMKGNLLRVDRSKGGRLLGKFKIGSDDVTYKLFMGQKASCDSSYANCEGIVIKYEEPDNTVLMMGDVNYASYNIAVTKYNNSVKSASGTPETEFADTQIDYLIVPHHGSEHTAYDLITDSGRVEMQGKQAIICCTNKESDNRPNKDHRDELERRFEVATTEKEGKATDFIQIQL